MRQTIRLPIIGTIPLRIAAPLLAVDAALIAMFLLWAWAAHYDLSALWVYDQVQFSLEEGALTEQWGYIKLAVASAFAAMIAWPRRHCFYWGLAALLTIMLLSDSLELHEQITAALAALTNGQVSPVAIDPLTKATLAGAPLTVMAIGLYRAPQQQRGAMVALALPAVILGAWSAIVDLIHAVHQALFHGNETIVTLLEEGGESALITLTTVIIAGSWAQDRRAAPTTAIPQRR